MFLSEFINEIYKMSGDLNSEIEIRDTDGNTLILEECGFEKDCCNVITINTGNY